MAVTNVSLSDAVSAWVTKTNTIASDLGDRATLETTASGNLVAAINEIHGKALDTDSASTRLLLTGNKGLSYNSTSGEFNIDSTNIVSFTRAAISVTDAGGYGSLAYNNSTGVLTFNGPSIADVRMNFLGAGAVDYDSASGVISLVALTSSHFSSPVTLTIYDSGGSALKVLRSPGS